MDKLLLKVSEAAELASLGRSKAYELVATGEWPSVSIGRAVRVPVDDLRAWIEQRKRLTSGSNAGDGEDPR